MKQIIISFLLVMVLVACNELADNKPANTTERFPSFTHGKKTEKPLQLTPLVKANPVLRVYPWCYMRKNQWLSMHKANGM